MKQPSSFFLVRWWREAELQKRLLSAFTALFLYCIVMLAVFLYMSVRLMEVHETARVIFEQNQRVSQLFNLTSRFELAINHYEIAPNERAWVNINALSAQIDDQVILLEAQLWEDDYANLASFKEQKKLMEGPFEELIAAVDAGDEVTANDLDTEVYTYIDTMNEDLWAITDRGWASVEASKAEYARFSNLMKVSLAIGLPLFLFLAGVVTVVIYQQINRPLDQVALAAGDLLAGKFHAAQLQGLVSREDEIGLIGREFVEASGLVVQREAQMAQEAGEIWAKIR